MAPVAWIAGGGARGVWGAAVARRFATGGFRVVLTGRKQARLDLFAQQLRATGASADVVAGDLTPAETVARMGHAVGQLGYLKAAIFNAGNMEVRGAPLELSPEAFEQMWRVGTF